MPVPVVPIIAAVGSLIGGLLSSGSANSSSKRNLQAVRETNQANREIAELNNANMLEQQSRKMQFDIDMWNKQNEYNSPAAQKARLQEAGYNPYMQDMPAGNATSSPTMETYTPDSAQMQPYIEDPNLYTQSIMQIANAPAEAMAMYQQELQARQLATSNKYQELMLLKQLKSMDLDISDKELTNAAKMLMNDFNRESYKTRMDMLNVELTQKALNNSLLSKQVEFLPQQQRMEVAKFSADLATIAINNDMTKTQMRNVVLQSEQLKALTDGLKLDNKQKERVMNAVVNNAYYQATLTKYQVHTEFWKGKHQKNNSNADNWYQRSYDLGHAGAVLRGIGNVTGSIGNFFGLK